MKLFRYSAMSYKAFSAMFHDGTSLDSNSIANKAL